MATAPSCYRSGYPERIRTTSPTAHVGAFHKWSKCLFPTPSLRVKLLASPQPVTATRRARAGPREVLLRPKLCLPPQWTRWISAFLHICKVLFWSCSSSSSLAKQASPAPFSGGNGAGPCLSMTSAAYLHTAVEEQHRGAVHLRQGRCKDSGTSSKEAAPPLKTHAVFHAGPSAHGSLVDPG